jgi:hypothetical protein
MKDKDLNLEDVKTPHTLGSVSYILLVTFLHIDSAEGVVSLFEVDLQKPRNLSEIHHKTVLFRGIRKTRTKPLSERTNSIYVVYYEVIKRELNRRRI